MFILGIHGGRRRAGEEDPSGHAFHDAAAALIEDGTVIAAIEEERLDRIKHSNCFPVRAIARCLDRAGITLGQVDWIATNISAHVADHMEKYARLENSSYRDAADGRACIARLLASAFGEVVPRDRILCCHHHLAHAWSAFAPVPFPRSLILSIDGDGDNCSGMVLVGEWPRLIKLRELATVQSLGGLYRTLIQIVGYRRFDEYKVMGLAPYGDPGRFADLFAECYRLLPQGQYAFDDSAGWFGRFEAAGVVDQARRKGDPFTQVHMDFSAALQQTLEKIVFHMLEYFAASTGERRLCLAGGVAHNCTLNGKLASSGLFDEIYVQPAAHDAGGALGAAWWAYVTRDPQPRRPRLPHLFLGSDLGDDAAIAARLDAWGDFVTCEHLADPAQAAARLLASGSVIGWAQGRSEFGPRALGHRSILADPRPADYKRLVNEMVKKRESYRPFAPSVLEERAGEFFELPAGQHSYPFMILVVSVREHARELLGAITHVDGTARIQTVGRDADPLYWRLINEFDRLTGVPLVLNTSFNNHAEPIVDSLDDVMACFLTTGLDALIAGSYLVVKRDAAARERALLRSAPAVPLSRRLVRKTIERGAWGEETIHQIESTKGRDFGRTVVAISAPMYEALQNADAGASFAERLGDASPADRERHGALAAELFELWGERMVTIRPRTAISPIDEDGLAIPAGVMEAS